MNPNLYKCWAQKSAENAISLAEEARIIFQAEHYPRAYYLAHMSIEESSKAILLYAMSTGETPVSEHKKVTALLRNHKKKIEFLVTYVEKFSGELRNSIMSMKDDLISHINNLKNDTMYVSCSKSTKIVSPMDRISNVDIRSYLNLSEKLSAYSKVLTNY
ncbi:MAG: AbiV family abortive infection protein [Candidatus Heimdallarchaeota archaeon]|nr:AbiV family abortive infection protein [Candidatus Heimdallarchaeota archaeon]